MSYLRIKIAINRHIFNFSSLNSQTLATNCRIPELGMTFARTKVWYGIYVKTERRKEV